MLDDPADRFGGQGHGFGDTEGCADGLGCLPSCGVRQCRLGVGLPAGAELYRERHHRGVRSGGLEDSIRCRPERRGEYRIAVRCQERRDVVDRGAGDDVVVEDHPIELILDVEGGFGEITACHRGLG